MTIDTNLEYISDRPGFWLEVASMHHDRCHRIQGIHAQHDFADQILLQPIPLHNSPQNRAFSLHPQSLQHDQQWTPKEIALPRQQTNPFLSPPWAARQDDIDRHEDGQDVSDMYTTDQTAHGAGQTSHNVSMPGQLRHAEPPPFGHLHHQSSVDFGKDLLRNSHDTVNENIFADWCWGVGQRNASGFIDEDLESSFGSPRSSTLSISSDPMHPSSAIHENVPDQKDPGTKVRSRSYSHELHRSKLRLSASPGRQAITRPILRTKTSAIDQDILSTTQRVLSSGYISSALHEHRLLSACGPRREKLTGEQKRRNHILHEKKRRAMIKDGFDDLLELVPDIKNRGLSKSAILFKAAAWLVNLTCANKALRVQARALEGANLYD